MLNAVQLRTFCTVLETGSFAAAAQALGYTASAVSQQVRTLEQQTGVTLFVRRARSAQPTDAARAILPYAQRAVAHLEQLDLEFQACSRGERSVVRIGSFPTASATFVPLAMSQLRQEKPHIAFELREGEINYVIQLLERGAVDLGLVYEYPLVPQRYSEHLRRSRIASEEMVAIVPASHRLADGGSIDIARLANDVWIANCEGTHGERSLARLCALHGFTPEVRYQTNDTGVMIGLVNAGFGVSLVPALALVRATSALSVTTAKSRRERHIVALTRRDDDNPAATLLMAHLRRAFAQTLTTIHEGNSITAGG